MVKKSSAAGSRLYGLLAFLAGCLLLIAFAGCLASQALARKDIAAPKSPATALRPWRDAPAGLPLEERLVMLSVRWPIFTAETPMACHPSWNQAVCARNAIY